MSKCTYLIFRLEGPLQSWGERSKWIYRDTADFPSKSGIVGLIACAMGLRREDPEIGELCQKLMMAVRAERRGSRVMDFHTIQSLRMMTASRGQRNKNGELGTILSYRYYLQDASFLVALDGEWELLEKIRQALSDPRWQIYLGRKSCVPSIPVIGSWCSDYETLEQLMRNYPLAENGRRADAQILYQLDSADESGQMRSDMRLASEKREYARRRVKTGRINREEILHVSF